MIRDIEVHWSTGLTVGSVIPHQDSCLRNVTFRDCKMYHPLKGIYIKNDPDKHQEIGPSGGGLVRDITYENIEVHNPYWYPIYIGP